MSALSKDLRQRILNYALVNPVRETARIFQVSPNTVHLLKALWYETGGIEPRPGHAVHAHAVSPEGELFLQTLLLEDVDLTLEELCAFYAQAYGVRVGVATMHLTLKRMGLSDKKKTVWIKCCERLQRSLLYGHPPKVVWIRRGNCSVRHIDRPSAPIGVRRP